MAQDGRQITGEERSISCGTAMTNSWEDWAGYAQSLDFEIGALLFQSVCGMALTTNNPYDGNVYSISARYSGYIGDFVQSSSKYLLKDNDKQDIFVALVTGSNVPNGSPNVFVEMVSAWENIPTKRGALENAAKFICLSIDRYNVQGLEDIRANECMTPPFVFPPRGE